LNDDPNNSESDGSKDGRELGHGKDGFGGRRYELMLVYGIMYNTESNRRRER